MKRIILLTLAIATVVGACSKTRPHKVKDSLVEAKWKVLYIHVDNTDLSYFFEYYLMDFTKEGNITTTDGKNTFSGTWDVAKANLDQESGKKTYLTMSFSHESSFDQLNHSWEVTSLSDSRIELRDQSVGNYGDEVTLIKQ